MKIPFKKAIASIGVSGLIIAALWGNLIYMNLRASDPILPGWEEYNAERFDALMATDEPVMVEIYASWCPTCLLQHRALDTLHQENRPLNMRAIRVDYDRDEAFRKKHGYHYTGIMTIFQNGRERARESGLITADKIEEFVNEYRRKATENR